MDSLENHGTHVECARCPAEGTIYEYEQEPSGWTSFSDGTTERDICPACVKAWETEVRIADDAADDALCAAEDAAATA